MSKHEKQAERWQSSEDFGGWRNGMIGTDGFLCIGESTGPHADGDPTDAAKPTPGEVWPVFVSPSLGFFRMKEGTRAPDMRHGPTVSRLRQDVKKKHGARHIAVRCLGYGDGFQYLCEMPNGLRAEILGYGEDEVDALLSALEREKFDPEAKQ